MPSGQDRMDCLSAHNSQPLALRRTKEGDANKGTYAAYGGGKTYDPWGKKLKLVSEIFIF